jgi:hypothetical protein
MTNNNCPQIIHQCTPDGLFINVVTYDHYNICTAPFNYPNLSLCNHEVIRVFCDVQIFSCPTNENVTRVHCATTLETGTSGALMTFGAIHRRLEASCAEITFNTMNFRTESPPYDPAPPRP